ncbi:DUF3219 family protein [Indiicoccus explosivorum]|uniref:DUF3219 family protein n=1 Tax=Indiicoccus explosivorum TaxID=1917864 RepID=UPI00240A24E1|nr:DUF3219 family protein [Indiicoccus explosivorum]
MDEIVLLNKKPFTASNVRVDSAGDRKLIRFDFQVTHSEYHDVTVLLYQNDFQVEAPERGLQFRAEIRNYSTSVTNLYEEGSVGDFHLELIEKR